LAALVHHCGGSIHADRDAATPGERDQQAAHPAAEIQRHGEWLRAAEMLAQHPEGVLHVAFSMPEKRGPRLLIEVVAVVLLGDQGGSVGIAPGKLIPIGVGVSHECTRWFTKLYIRPGALARRRGEQARITDRMRAIGV